LESLKSEIKLKRPKSTENLTFRDRNKIDLKYYVAPRSIYSRNAKQDFNDKPLYFDTLNDTKKEGLQTMVVSRRQLETGEKINQIS
jgi:hypothetical protein